MKKFGLIGHPVKHSLSPAMQNAAFKELGINARYEIFDVEPEALNGFLDDLKKGAMCGLNVTVPHKIKAKEYIEKNGTLDTNAARLGAVNTIKIEPGGTLCGFNTDGPGFYRSLVEDLRFEPEGRDVFILGAGGAASAVTMYLGKGPKRITVSDIDKAKLAGLEKQYAKYYDIGKLKTVGPDGVKKAVEECELLINATPVGMKDGDPSPIDKGFLRPGLRVYDLVYNRPYTQLVKDANSAKAHAVTGLGMLLYQGAIAFEIWTAQAAPIHVMKRALKAALGK